MTAGVCVDTVDAVQGAVLEASCVLPSAGGSKPALSAAPSANVTRLDLGGLSGIVEYDPQELTITAMAGTPVAQLRDALAVHGQHLPFDPPLAESGATIGGIVAAGTSGPSAFGFGGVRDFIIGVRFIDGTGRLVRGGGRVVKNAAGFDLPKLMVGSLGRLGVLVELSFKVLPKPRASVTAILEFARTTDALDALAAVAGSSLPTLALDLIAPKRVVARFTGGFKRLPGRLATMTGSRPGEFHRAGDDARLWHEAAALSWLERDEMLIRAPLTLQRANPLLRLVERSGARARISLAGNLAWIAWPEGAPLDQLDSGLTALDTGGLVLTGSPERIILGRLGGGAFASRVRDALDPDRRFLPF